MIDLPSKKIFVLPVIITALCEIEFTSKTALDFIILVLQDGFVHTALPV
jgi:hypothetical protein